MECQYAKDMESSKFVPHAGEILSEWLQYYSNPRHHLPVLRTSGPCLKKAILPKAHEIHVHTIAPHGAAPSPIYWRGCVYVLKGLKLYEGQVKDGVFTLLHELDLSGDVENIDIDGGGGVLQRLQRELPLLP